MPDRIPDQTATPGTAAALSAILHRHRKPLTVGLAVCALALLAALTIPVGLPDTATANTGGRLSGDQVAVAPVEDLTTFRTSRRWGVSFEETEAARRARELANGTADARRDRMGFVGTTATPDDRVVLLTLPGGGVARIPAGGVLPDGRTLSSVTDTTVTLSGSEDEELELFPRPPTDPAGPVRDGLVPSRPSGADLVGDGLVPSRPCGAHDSTTGRPVPNHPRHREARRARTGRRSTVRGQYATRRPRGVTMQHCAARTRCPETELSY